nr:hypothetical protein 10 [bacterium]
MFQIQITDYGVVQSREASIDADGVEHYFTDEIESPYVADICTLSEAMNWIKQLYSDIPKEDDIIVQLIQNARQWVEQHIGQSVIKKNIVAYSDYKLSQFELPLPPIQTISEVVRVALDGTETELTLNDDYYVEGLTRKNLIFYHTWTTGGTGQIVGIKVTYTAYMDEVPAPIKTAVLRLVADNYYMRSSAIDTSISIVPHDVIMNLKPYKMVQMF